MYKQCVDFHVFRLYITRLQKSDILRDTELELEAVPTQ